ncbi:MAG: hypothetical protein U0168_23400 [Nannocystaceae bacterium]
MNRGFALVLLALACALVPGAAWPELAPRARLGDALALPLLGGIKLALQLLAAGFASACARTFSRDDRPRRSFRALALAMSGFAAGQAVLLWWHGRGLDAPFPSPADACFIPATIVLALALADFAVAHARGGLSLVTPAQLRRTAGLATVVGAAALGLPLAAALRGLEGPLTQTIAAAYPVLDLAVVVPAAVVLRQLWLLRGSPLWRAWSRVLAGVVCLSLSDVGFAYVAAFELARLDPLLDFGFAAGYLLVAWGAWQHRRALA